jgi:lichenan operon transcriptional antiterminator
VLNIRQQNILDELEKHSSSFVTSDYLVKKFDVSLRTIQSDMKKVREFVNDSKAAEIISVASKGSKLVIHDPVVFQKILGKKIRELSNQSDRVRKLCILLLNQRRAVSRPFLVNQLFVSTSTLTNDLNEADKILSDYRLTIARTSKSGIRIYGKEEDKRKCLLKLGNLETDQEHKDFESRENTRQEIEKIVVSVLLKHRFHISDTLFQNLIVHIEMAIKRMNEGFSIQDSSSEYENLLQEEIDVAEEIFHKLGARFHFASKKAEVINLAIYIKGKSDYENDVYISEEVNSFILDALEEINDKFNIDFRQEIDLRISLALHLIPLLTRIDYNIQNENQMLDQIKQSFPLAFDIAAYMCLLLQRKTSKKVDEGEIAYLAIYFNQFITKYNDISGKQRILIITSLKRSESILLRQRFATWFSKEISVLTLLNVHEVSSINIEDYDVIFTTEQTALTEKMGAILTSFFPSESEYSKIKLAIDGFKDKFEIIDLFHQHRFFYGSFQSKEEVIKKLCLLSQDKVNDKVGELQEAVFLREELGSSYF